nr:MAG TPA: hypothetical protein [Caudoviricetes sp.]
MLVSGVMVIFLIPLNSKRIAPFNSNDNIFTVIILLIRHNCSKI